MPMKFVYALAVFFLLSCKDSKTTVGSTILKVDLSEKSVAMSELFDKIVVVPLETKDSSFIIRPQKIIVDKNEYFVFDEGIPAVLVFDDRGRLLRKIGKKGQGPGEYREIYDAVVNRADNRVYMLSPFGSIYCYTLAGEFIKKIELPMKANYQTMEEFDKEHFVTWTIPSSLEEPGVSLVSKDSVKEVKGFWYENRILNSQNPRVFYQYDKRTYFSTPFHNEVYTIGKDSLQVSYRWDFGKDNIDLKKAGFTLTPDKEQEEDKLLLQYLLDSTIPYILSRQQQNDKFYYAKLTFGFRIWKNLFYRKKDGKSFFFEKTAEGIPLRPLAFNNDYLICLVNNDDFENYKQVLPEEEYRKLEQRLEDDNPCLIKFYFK